MTRRSAMMLLAGTMLFAAPVSTPAAGPPVRATLANPGVRLWYEETGRLSGNIAQTADISLWNTIIGGGAAEENANDALFTVELRTQGQQNVLGPLTLTATGERGKVLASRTMRDLLTSEEGKMVAPLWVRDVGCAGTVNFTARLGASRQSARLDFNCGE